LPGALASVETMSRYDANDLREAAAIFTARDPMLSRAASAVSARSGLVRAMRPDDNKAFLVGNGAYRIDHCSRGRLLQQPQQARSGLGPTHPAERTGRFPRDDAISVIEQLRQQRNGAVPSGAASDLFYSVLGAA
jgi:hypothetical protein